VDQTSDKASQASELFMELASETRLSILAYLNDRPAKLSSISREVNTTVQICIQKSKQISGWRSGEA